MFFFKFNSKKQQMEQEERKMKVDNAIIMAAGTSSRFAPLSYEKHKALTIVKGEVLIERQIRQLQEAGISDIIVITGYKAEQFNYLKERFKVRLLYNPDYLSRNNNGSIWIARELIGNTYICSSDNYFSKNPFESQVDDAYYAAEFSEGDTKEWCMNEDEKGYINRVTIGGKDAWYMYGHTFWSKAFSKEFIEILEKEYDLEETKGKLWEKIFMEHLDVLKMRIRKYEKGIIHEFDTLDELREFDPEYINDTHSSIIRKIAFDLKANESDVKQIAVIRDSSNEVAGFEFDCNDRRYAYFFEEKRMMPVKE